MSKAAWDGAKIGVAGGVCIIAFIVTAYGLAAAFDWTCRRLAA